MMFCRWCSALMVLDAPTGLRSCDHCDLECHVGTDGGCSWCIQARIILELEAHFPTDKD